MPDSIPESSLQRFQGFSSLPRTEDAHTSISTTLQDPSHALVPGVETSQALIVDATFRCHTNRHDRQSVLRDIQRNKETQSLSSCQKSCLGSKSAEMACTICSATFERMQNLRRHQKRHAGKRPHVCRRCLIGFSKEPRLLGHICHGRSERLILRGKRHLE